MGVGPKPPPVLVGPPSVEESRVEQEVERGGHVDGEGRHRCWLGRSYVQGNYPGFGLNWVHQVA